MRAVLDSNIHVSALINPAGPPGQILDHWLEGRFDLILSAPIIGEIRRALQRPKAARHLRRDPEWIDRFLARLALVAIMVEPVAVHGVSRDEDDDPILGTALAASANYVVTGDNDLLSLGSFRSILIITPRQFLNVLASMR